METVSNNPPQRRRGRPRAFSSSYLQFIKANGHSHLLSRRQVTNVAYAWHAMYALKNRRFAWIVDWERGDCHEPRYMKLMVLSELGRFRDARIIRSYAKLLCKDKPSPVHKAVAILRAARQLLAKEKSEAGV